MVSPLEQSRLRSTDDVCLMVSFDGTRAKMLTYYDYDYGYVYDCDCDYDYDHGCDYY